MATIAFFYEVCALLAAALMFVAFLRGVQGVPLPPETRSRRQGALTGLSVVVLVEPGTDAEHCVAAVLAQDYPTLDVVFVLAGGAALDAASSARVEGDPRARVLSVPDPPAGWTRQNDAYAAGFRQARHDYILFMDANVLLREQGLERVLGLASKRGADLLTIFPAMTSTSWVERLLVPFFLQLTLTGVSLHKINDPHSDAAGGFAPFFLFRRAAYEALGGHAAVRADRFSDSSLAQRVKDRGYRLLLTDGTEIAVLQGQSRLRDIWSSWSQGFSEAIDNDVRQAFLLAGVVIALFAVPWALLVWAVIAMLLSPGPVSTSPWLGVMLIGSANVMVGMLHRRSLCNVLDVDDSLAWLQPLAAVITGAMIVGAAFDVERMLPTRRTATESRAAQPTGTNR